MEMQSYAQQIQIEQQQLDDVNQKLQITELYLKLVEDYMNDRNQFEAEQLQIQKCLGDLQIKRKQLECYQEQLKQEYLEIKTQIKENLNEQEKQLISKQLFEEKIQEIQFQIKEEEQRFSQLQHQLNLINQQIHVININIQNEQNNLEQINLQFNKSSEKLNDVKIQVKEFQSQQRELVQVSSSINNLTTREQNDMASISKFMNSLGDKMQQDDENLYNQKQQKDISLRTNKLMYLKQNRDDAMKQKAIIENDQIQNKGNLRIMKQGHECLIEKQFTNKNYIKQLKDELIIYQRDLIQNTSGQFVHLIQCQNAERQFMHKSLNYEYLQEARALAVNNIDEIFNIDMIFNAKSSFETAKIKLSQIQSNIEDKIKVRKILCNYLSDILQDLQESYQYEQQTLARLHDNIQIHNDIRYSEEQNQYQMSDGKKTSAPILQLDEINHNEIQKRRDPKENRIAYKDDQQIQNINNDISLLSFEQQISREQNQIPQSGSMQ